MPHTKMLLLRYNYRNIPFFCKENENFTVVEFEAPFVSPVGFLSRFLWQIIC